MTKEESPQFAETSDSLSTVSFILGLCSLLGPGLFLGIPAIITGAISLKKNQDSGLGLAGIVTGSISTAISVLIIALVIWIIIWGIHNPFLLEQTLPAEYHPFESSAT